MLTVYSWHPGKSQPRWHLRPFLQLFPCGNCLPWNCGSSLIFSDHLDILFLMLPTWHHVNPKPQGAKTNCLHPYTIRPPWAPAHVIAWCQLWVVTQATQPDCEYPPLSQPVLKITVSLSCVKWKFWLLSKGDWWKQLVQAGCPLTGLNAFWAKRTHPCDAHQTPVLLCGF